MTRTTTGVARWEVLRSRLDGLAQRQQGQRSRESLEALLAQRAEVLAREPPQAESDDGIPVLTVCVDDATFAMEAVHVVEVTTLDMITAVPGVPEFVLGVVGRRGEIVSIVDLARFLGVGGRATRPMAVFVEVAGFTVGLAVDRVEDTAVLHRHAVRPLPSHLSVRTARFMQGVSGAGAAVLDLPALLAAEELVVDQLD